MTTTTTTSIRKNIARIVAAYTRLPVAPRQLRIAYDSADVWAVRWTGASHGVPVDFLIRLRNFAAGLKMKTVVEEDVEEVEFGPQWPPTRRLS